MANSLSISNSSANSPCGDNSQLPKEHDSAATISTYGNGYYCRPASDDGTDYIYRMDSDREKEKRTRRRFTTAQLTLLEQLYHRVSHPTREQREVVAREGDMELRSVTIWFQNKRQTERRSATSLPNASENSPPPHFPSTNRRPFSSHSQGKGYRSGPLPSRQMCRTLSTPALPPSSLARGRIAPLARSTSLNIEAMSSHSGLRTSLPVQRCSSLPSALEYACENASRAIAKSRRPTLSRRPTMENVLENASSSSRRVGMNVHTGRPTGTNPEPQPSPQIYDVMPSSPITSSPQRIGPHTPEAHRGFVEYGRVRKRTTLEWACAAARLNGRRDNASSHPERKALRGFVQSEPSGDETETDIDELPTPHLSFAGGSPSTSASTPATPATSASISEPTQLMKPAILTDVMVIEPQEHSKDEDTMRAALALCGLGAGL